VAYTYKVRRVRTHSLSENYINFLYLISELFGSVRKTCWCSIVKLLATRCQILRKICIKFDFRWGSVPYPTGGDYSAPPDPVAVFKRPIQGEGERRERRERGGMWREGKGGRRTTLRTPCRKFLDTPLKSVAVIEP